jgi:ADP-ribosylation factor protein 1
MGVSFSNIKDTIFGKKELRIIMIGLVNAGKTSILYKLNKTNPNTKNISYAFEHVKYKNQFITSWDTSCSEKLRPLWKHLYQCTDGVVYVVDSSDRDRIDEAAEDFKKIINMEQLINSPVVVFANKQDLKYVISLNEIAEKLELKSMMERRWHIQGTSGCNGEGLCEGLDWMLNILDRN